MAGRGRSNSLLVLIGVFKLVKAALLIAVATGAVEIVENGDGERPVDLILRYLPVEHYRGVGEWLSSHLSALTPHRLVTIAIAAAVYAALFIVERVGLLMRKRWGEIVTVVITASFIPLEVYELIKHASVGKIIAIVLNVAIVGYLVWRLRSDRKDSQDS